MSEEEKNQMENYLRIHIADAFEQTFFATAPDHPMYIELRKNMYERIETASMWYKSGYEDALKTINRA